MTIRERNDTTKKTHGTAEPKLPPALQERQIHVVAPQTLPEGATFKAFLLPNEIKFTAQVPEGGVLSGSIFSVPYPKTTRSNKRPSHQLEEEPRVIRVMAPGTLNAGDRFEAEIDGIRFHVVVPEGGVHEGEYFQTYHPLSVALPTKDDPSPPQRRIQTKDDPSPPQRRIHVVAPTTLCAGDTFEAFLVRMQFTTRVPPGGVRPGGIFSVPHPCMENSDSNSKEPELIRVMAPGALNAGDQFKATIDGICFYVVVPEGGVQQGQYFDTYHPSSVAMPSKACGPVRRSHDNGWRTSADCFGDKSNPNYYVLCCMAWVCPAVVHFQVWQRLTPQNLPSICGPCPIMTCVVAIWFGLLVTLIVCMGTLGYKFEDDFVRAPYIYIFLGIFVFGCWVHLCMFCTRKSIRKHYGIAVEGERECDICCGDPSHDPDNIAPCGYPCSAIQLASQTHDSKDYPYILCSTTGLPSNAPAIV